MREEERPLRGRGLRGDRLASAMLDWVNDSFGQNPNQRPQDPDDRESPYSQSQGPSYTERPEYDDEKPSHPPRPQCSTRPLDEPPYFNYERDHLQYIRAVIKEVACPFLGYRAPRKRVVAILTPWLDRMLSEICGPSQRISLRNQLLDEAFSDRPESYKTTVL